MQHLESRLIKLETSRQVAKRRYSDIELAHRLAYIIERGETLAPPGAWELLKKTGLIQGHPSEKH